MGLLSLSRKSKNCFKQSKCRVRIDRIYLLNYKLINNTAIKRPCFKNIAYVDKKKILFTMPIQIGSETAHHFQRNDGYL